MILSNFMVKSKIHRIRHFIPLSMLIIITGIIISCTPAPVSGSPEISRFSVTPRSGAPDDEFVFLVTYNSLENKPPDYIQLVTDHKRFDLTPVNAQDNNFSDGKEYIVKRKFSEGIHIYYFEASDGNQSTSSMATTLAVEAKNEFTHLDVAYSLLFATFLIIIPVIYGIYQLRRLSNSVDKLVGSEAVKHKKKFGGQTPKN